MPFMSLFSSARERRLWLWALVVVAAIYATLSVTPTLARLLRDRDLISNGFWLGMLLLGVGILVLALKVRPGGLEIGVALGVIGAYLIVLMRMTVPEERSHMIEYSIVAALIYEALKERKRNGRHVPKPALLAILITVLVGFVDECIQIFLPNRVFDLFDIFFNTLAATMAVTAIAALTWARHWGKRKQDQLRK